MTATATGQSERAGFGSPWHEGDGPPARPPLERELAVDVAVVGAGIVGVTAAIELQRRGVSVAVLEARSVAAAASGNNTAKLSALQGRAYSEIAGVRCDAGAPFAAANQAGIERIAALADELGIECSFRRLTNYTYADLPEQLEPIEREAEAAADAGLAVQLVDSTPLPFEVAGAVALPDQAEFDPVAYLRGLATALDADGQVVFEGSRVLAIDGDRLRTEFGTVTAERIVLATHLPIVDRIGLFARAEPKASFAVTARIPGGLPDGMYMDGAEQYSLRSLRAGERELLIVGGQSHRLGTKSPSDSFARLTAYARRRFGAREFDHRWDAHDFVSEDRLPFVGSVSPRSDRILTATGLSKWGLALGAACAGMLAARIAGEPDAWPPCFDSRRLPRPRAWPTLARYGAETGVHLVGDRLKRGSDELERGEGRVIGSGLGQRAVYRDQDGQRHVLSARCTHLGCIVAFNPEAKTWDCPCHGSRFDVEGAVLEGPATAPLEPADD